MPVFRSREGTAPAWCELQAFDIVHLAEGERRVFDRAGRKERLIVGKGSCLIEFEGQRIFAVERTSVQLTTADGAFKVEAKKGGALVVRLSGNWGEELGGSGVFLVAKPEQRMERGDFVAYPKETSFDSHYHDCDEYWIVLEGRGIAVSEGKQYEVGPGDCVATGMGHHHDFPIVHEPVRAVFFETTLQGRKRRGHLWDQQHGQAKPIEERV